MFGRTRRDNAMSVYSNAARGKKSVVAKAARSRRGKKHDTERTETIVGTKKQKRFQKPCTYGACRSNTRFFLIGRSSSLLQPGYPLYKTDSL